MKKMMVVVLALSQISLTSLAQERLWSEGDRKYLLDNLIRSRDELIAETKGLTQEQLLFKESPDRWSINEIVEHIAIWELLLEYRISRQIGGGPQPDMAKNAISDSESFEFIMEEKKHISTDYTQPFTYTLPRGESTLESNLSWILRMRTEAINHVAKTDDDLRLYYVSDSRSNAHQVYITLFGHTDRHIRQIRKVKQHSGYPM